MLNRPHKSTHVRVYLGGDGGTCGGLFSLLLYHTRREKNITTERGYACERVRQAAATHNSHAHSTLRRTFSLFRRCCSLYSKGCREWERSASVRVCACVRHDTPFGSSKVSMLLLVAVITGLTLNTSGVKVDPVFAGSLSSRNLFVADLASGVLGVAGAIVKGGVQADQRRVGLPDFYYLLLHRRTVLCGLWGECVGSCVFEGGGLQR